jgi:hypothetical protein
MWKAAKANRVNNGGDAAEFESKRPAQWERLPATVEFIECVAGSLDVGKSHIQKTRGGRGVGPTI